jgi:hypothetical protein
MQLFQPYGSRLRELDHGHTQVTKEGGWGIRTFMEAKALSEDKCLPSLSDATSFALLGSLEF